MSLCIPCMPLNAILSKMSDFALRADLKKQRSVCSSSTWVSHSTKWTHGERRKIEGSHF